MADLLLKGPLNLNGSLELKTSAGGKVKANDVEVLVEGQSQSVPPSGHGMAPAPVPIPPPPLPPSDPKMEVWILKSFNMTVTANGKAVVVQGLCAQGTMGWPGMVQAGSSTVKVNGMPLNVVNDTGTILPSGASVTFTASGQ